MSTFTYVLREAGIDINDVDADRIEVWQPVPTSDHPRKRNGRVFIRPDGSACIKNWATDVTVNWAADRNGSPAAVTRKPALVTDTRERLAETGAGIAQRTWDKSKPASPDHPYLLRKKLPPLDLHEVAAINGWPGRWLIAPLYSAGPMHVIRNLESINEKGEKRPVKGALRAACYGFAGRGMPTDSVVICEGWASAAAISIAFSIPVLFAAGKGNLEAVAQIWRGALRHSLITVAADSDAPGMRAARQAARAVNGLVVAPKFGPAHEDWTDWCDVYTNLGVDILREWWSRG